MRTPQEMFNQLQELKHERKSLQAVYRDALSSAGDYKKLTDEIKTMREKRKMIIQAVEADLRSELDRLDEIKNEINNDKALLADAVINQMTKGEPVTVVDEYQEKYEPVFTVTFRKEGSN
ncbi:MAG TPA: hypothetical protein PKN62_03380 [bacterium]|nr:hypothetical protein [bacterium]